MSSFGKFVLGTLVGGVLGAVIGLLLAPRSGKETRTLIADEFSNRCNDSMEAVREKGEAVKSKFKEKTEQFEEAGRRVLNKVNGTSAGASSAPEPTEA